MDEIVDVKINKNLTIKWKNGINEKYYYLYDNVINKIPRKMFNYIKSHYEDLEIKIINLDENIVNNKNNNKNNSDSIIDKVKFMIQKEKENKTQNIKEEIIEENIIENIKNTIPLRELDNNEIKTKDLIEKGLQLGIIEKQNATYFFGKKRLEIGFDKTIHFLDQEMYIKEEIINKIIEIENNI